MYDTNVISILKSTRPKITIVKHKMSQYSRNSSEDENLLESQERHVTRLTMSKMSVMKRIFYSYILKQKSLSGEREIFTKRKIVSKKKKKKRAHFLKNGSSRVPLISGGKRNQNKFPDLCCGGVLMSVTTWSLVAEFLALSHRQLIFV